MNRFPHVMVLALIAAGLVAMLGATAAAQQQEDVSPAGNTPAAQPEVTEAPAPSAEGADGATVEDQAIDGGQGAPTSQPGDGQGGDQGGGSKFTQLLPLLLGGMVLMWIFAGRKSRKADKSRKSMLADLKKGDKVTSIGGIVGTAMDVREHDVVVKVDETSNTRMKFARWAIRSVGTPADEADTETK